MLLNVVCSLVALSAADNATAASLVNEPYIAWAVERAATGPMPASVATRLPAGEVAKLVREAPKLPFDELTVGERTKDGTLWVGSKNGLMMLAPEAKRWRLFHSQRWLPDDDVQDLAVAEDGSVWVKTPQGLGRLIPYETTLERKMGSILNALRKYHVREGLVGEIELKTQGKAEDGGFQPSSDNDGLWTSIYVGAEVFRYGATADPQAKENAWRSLKALMFLEEITGIPGFAARSFVPKSEDPKRYGGEWHPSADGKWWWKGDTSSDELDGHYFAYAAYYDIAATQAERELIASYVERMTDHILDHGYYYVGPPGKPTTWGVWAPEKINHDMKWIDDRGLNSLEILSHLKVAEHIVRKPRYTEALKDLIEKHAYATNTVEQKWIWPPESVNHSDDELAFMAYYPLMQYERDPELRHVYHVGLQRSFEIERPEHSPLFNYIYAASKQADDWTDPFKRPDKPGVRPGLYDHDQCVAWFRDVPEDMIIWSVKNSTRRDIADRMANRFDKARSRNSVLPPSERRLMRWNGDPYELDGGADGRVRDDGAYVLLPYWMGRYHRFLE
jgi:hypothetical protein